ncbi:diacylglycerol O-acyltransferase 2-like isoform X1 [Clupea harengus]|uniref:Acyltransferase n=2 Tax=Clupea harengus TaxID=7950 RepID=A0A6P8FJ54_CLUHA|nr:diacylglycerol O-acyltransferase 2-like isoform X1 [Clupea harengus]
MEKKSSWKEFLESISVIQFIFTFLLMGVLCLLLMVYLMFTSLWILPILYLSWQIFDWDTPERGGRRSEFVRNWQVWKHAKDYFPVKLVKTAELNPSKNYILGCHPHGILSFGGGFCFNTEGCGFTEVFPGVRPCLAVLGGLFRIPLFRDYLMSTGLIPVSKRSIEHLLTRSGVGNAVVIITGGAEESLFSSPGVNTVVMKNRKGFVKLALENGTDLVPVYSFGETDTYRQVVLSEGSLGRKVQVIFKQVVGFAPCLFKGERWFLMPYRSPITTVVGSPITVPKAPSPTQEQVDHYHQLYIEALTTLFHKHKTSCGLAETHQICII